MKSALSDRITNGTGDERAVSPVVGVALLIAITVILAAVIGFVVLDTTVASTDTPNAKLEFQGTDPTVVQHKGGTELNSENIYIKVNRDGETIFDGNYAEYWDGEEISTGDSFEIDDTKEDDRIIVYWEDPQSDRDVLISETTVQ